METPFLQTGPIQQSRFLALVSNYDEYARALQVAEDSEGQGAIQYLKTMDSISTKIQEVKTAWQQLYASLGIEKVIKSVLSIVTKILKQLSNYNIGGLILNLIQNFITLKKVLKLVFNTGEKHLNTFVSKFNEAKQAIEKPIKITLDTSQAEQQLNALAQKKQQVNNGTVSTTSMNSAATTNGQYYAKVLKESKSLQSLVGSNYSFTSDINKGDQTLLTKQQANEMAQLWQKYTKSGGTSIEGFISSLEQGSQEVSETLSGTKVIDPKLLFAIGTGLQIAGSAAQVLSLTISPNSNSKVEGNKLLSGMGSIASGAGTGMSIGAMVGHPIIGAAVGAILAGLAGGISTIFDGLSIDYDEKLKMLQEEATELTNTQTEKKGEEASLESAITTYRELEAAQYDSAEAAEEYQEHMNTMAEQYPALVDHYDSAGNAIINVEKAEEALAKARHETAKATTDVLQNELKQKETEKEKVQEVYDDIGQEKYASYANGISLFNANGISSHTEGGIFNRETTYDISELYNSQGELFANTVKSALRLGEEDDVPDEISSDDLFAIQKALNEAYFGEDAKALPKDWTLAADSGLLSGSFSDPQAYSLTKITEEDFSRSGDIQRNAIEAIQQYAETIGFSYTEDLESLGAAELYEVYQSFLAMLEAKVGETEAVFKDTGELFAAADVKEQLTRQSLNDNDLSQNVEDYGTLMSQIGAQMVENTLGDISLDEAAIEGSENNADYNKAVDAASTALASLTEDQWEQIAKYWDDIGYYGTADDFKTAIEGLGLDADVTTALIDKYTEQTQDAKQRALDAIENSSALESNSKVNLTFLFNGNWNNLGSAYADQVVEIIKLIDDYTAEGLTQRAKSLTDAAVDIYRQISYINPSQQEALSPIIDAIDWNDASSIDKAVSSITDINDDNQYTSIISTLQAARKNLLFNVETELSLAAEAYEAAVEGATTLQKNASSGMDWADARAAFEQLKATGNFENLTWDTFVTYDEALQKFIYTDKGLDAVLSKQQTDIEKETANLNKAIADLEEINTALTEDTIDLSNIDSADDILNLKLEAAQKEQLQRWYLDWEELYEEGLETRDFSTYAKEIAAEQQAAANASLETLEGYSQQYSDLYVANQAALSKVKSNRSVLDKSLEYFSKTSLTFDEIAEYATLVGDDFKVFRDSLLAQGAIRFNNNTGEFDVINFDAYWDALGLGLSKETDAYLEARANWASNRISQEEKKAEAITSEIDKIFGGAEGDLIDLTYLESLGIALDEIGFETINGLYKIGNIDYQTLINEIETKGATALGNSLNSVKDKIIALFNDWASLLDEGLSGTLSFEKADILKKQFGLDELDFTQTAEGLKISSNAAYNLVAQISKIDKNAGQIAIEKMASNLAKAKEEYDDIYSVMREIEDIQQELTEVKVGSARYDALKAELAVAKELEQTLKDADDTFNFMDRDLPSGYDDPISAWEGVGDAMKVLNGDDFAAGKMDFTDFYNMVDFMGDDLVAAAFGFQGDALTAADLIEAGANAINMIDGEMFVDLSKLGANFNIGADGMKEGISQGIKKVAASQIEMLDAAIGVLETIVAMEEITKVDENSDGLIDFGEIFKVDGNNNVTEFTEQWDETRQVIANTLTGNGIDLNKTFIGDYSLRDILEGNIEYLNEIGVDWNKYQKIVNGLYQAVINGDYDASDIASIFQTISTSIGEESTFTIGERVIHITSSGELIEVDFSDEDTQKLMDQLELAKTNYEGNAEGLVTDFLSGKEDPAIDANIKTLLKITNQYTEEDGEAYYTASNGQKYKVPEGTSLSQFVKDTENKIEIDTIAGQTNSGMDQTSSITLSNNKTVNFAYSVSNGEVTAKKDGKTYTGTSLDDVMAQIEKDENDKLNKENAGLTESGTVEINGEVYTEYTLATGDTVIVDKNGSAISSDELNKRALEAAGFTPATEEIPLNINLTVTGVTAEQAASYATSLSSMQTSMAGMSELDFSSVSSFIDSISTVEEETASGLAAIKAELDALTAQGYVIDLTYNITQNTTNNETGNTSYSVSINDDGASSALAQVATAMSTVSSTASALTQELNKVPDKSSVVKNTASEMSKLPDRSSNVKNTASAMSKLPDKSRNVKNTADAINALKSKTITATVSVSVSVSKPSGATGSVSLSDGVNGRKASDKASMTTKLGSAKGNVALATGTLMGELGPELVVSGGRYFTVGENGAEFVNLADDAIVFNHLQTKKLLSSGSSTRGTPVTNERNATAFASGNALASASQALAELKSIRAMWQALLDMSAADLGAKAGSGGSGGSGGSPSGGSGGGGSGKETGPVEYDLERWYNLLRQIAKLEQQITYEQAKRENMQSGYKYADSLEKELDLLEKQLKTEKELASLQYDYYLKRMEDVNKSVYSKIFTYDSDGLMQYTDGKNRGLDALATLQATDENGVLKMSAKQQLNYITKTLGVSVKDLKYKSNGTEAKEDKDKVQVFFDNVDAIMDELDELYDSYHEHAEKIEDLTTSQNEILQEYVDNQRSLEDKLLQAIEDREQELIDQLTDEREALEKSSQAYIEGLSEALTKEQNLYNKNQTDTETAKMQRRLAILQRSGGSASEIKSLQDQIDSRLQDAYFQAQQDQIDAIQEASDKQLEKMQTQIDLMTETLEYQKENGLLWQEVYEMMNQWTPEQMLQFIEQYTKTYKENSSLENAESSKDTLKEAEIWANKRDKEARSAAWNSYYASANYSDTIKTANASAAQEAFENAYSSGGATAGAEAANKIFDDAVKAAEKPAESTPITTPSTTTPTTTTTTAAVTGKGTVKTKGGNLNVRKSASTKAKKLGSLKNKSSVTLTGYKDGWYQIKYNGGKGYVSADYIKTSDKKKLPKFAQGGLVDFTGPAWVDGSKNKPEAFLSAEDTALLKNTIFSDGNSPLKALVAAIEKITQGSRSYSTINEGGITIENATVNIQPGTISNDYDARRAGEMALEEMVKIARKTTNRVVRR